MHIFLSSLLIAVLLVLSRPGLALAYGFGERYDLPVPLSLYVTGAGATVALSFLAIGLFIRGVPGGHGYPRLNLLRWSAGRFFVHPAVLFPLKALSVGLLVLVIVGGLIGSQNPTKNIGPTLVWVVWWVGVAYTSAAVGNVWLLLNPWRATFGWAEGVLHRFNPNQSLALKLTYPRLLGVWPAIAILGAFAWVEIVFSGSGRPGNLALMALVYSVLTWTGMILFGKLVWLRHGEAFTVVFGFFARFAPTEIRVQSNAQTCEICSLECRDNDGVCEGCEECFGLAEPGRREFAFRPYVVGLVRNERVSASQMILVLMMLATVTFDGLTETPFWTNILTSSFATLATLGRRAFDLVNTAGVAGAIGLFVVLYLGFSFLMAVFVGARQQTVIVARTFVYSLIPIALAYHLAHFFSFFLIQGQLVIPLASDPFGLGWDIFGTKDYAVNIGIVNARIAWFVGVVAIVIGHIVAVYVAHVIALRHFRDHVLAMRSQRAMLVLMVAYTMVSLWIIAQPITEAAPPS